MLKALHVSPLDGRIPAFLMVLSSLVCFDAQAAPELPPLTSVRQIREMFSGPATQGNQVRLRGVVTFHDAKNGAGLFLQDGTGGIFVKLGKANNVNDGDEVEIEGAIKPGDVIQVIGFRVIGHPSEPAPLRIRIDQLSSGDYDSLLVRLRGRLLNRVELAREEILAMEATNLVLYARLDSNKTDSRIMGLQNGSELELTGVCTAQPLENVNPSLKSRPESFQLLLRSAGDVAVIHSPPWWTLSRLVWILGSLSVVFLGGFAWVFALDRKLRWQTRKVREQTAMIQQNLLREAVLEERTRLAREFHDTLEQELAAITIQLETVVSQFGAAPHAARQMLDVACNMARRSLFEARRAVWDLRSQLLENGNLPTAISEVAKAMAASTQAAISVETSGIFGKLPLAVENNLLRIVQEALANAVRHAHAAHIVVRLHYGPGRIAVQITDDGAGFDPNNNRPIICGGHFGLRDMSERAMKMGGRCNIISAPGQGTEILVEVVEKAGSAVATGAEYQHPARDVRTVSASEL